MEITNSKFSYKDNDADRALQEIYDIYEREIYIDPYGQAAMDYATSIGENAAYYILDCNSSGYGHFESIWSSIGQSLSRKTLKEQVEMLNTALAGFEKMVGMHGNPIATQGKGISIIENEIPLIVGDSSGITTENINSYEENQRNPEFEIANSIWTIATMKLRDKVNADQVNLVNALNDDEIYEYVKEALPRLIERAYENSERYTVKSFASTIQGYKDGEDPAEVVLKKLKSLLPGNKLGADDKGELYKVQTFFNGEKSNIKVDEKNTLDTAKEIIESEKKKEMVKIQMIIK